MAMTSTVTAGSAGVDASVITGTMAPPSIDEGIGVWLDQIDEIYRASDGETARVPWAHRKPCPSLVTWMNAVAPSLVRPGARVAVVGCGFGNDAKLLADRGYDVMAFDACPSAVAWARRLHPDCAECFVQADLLDLPGRLHGRFDLVAEVHTLQSLPPRHWAPLARGMGQLVSHRGHLLAIARGRETGTPSDASQGPPFPLTAEEMVAVMGVAGLTPEGEVTDFFDDNAPPVRRLRGLFKRV